MHTTMYIFTHTYVHDYIQKQTHTHMHTYTYAQFDLMLTTGTAAASLVSAIGGIFGMNLSNNPSGALDDSWTRFILV